MKDTRLIMGMPVTVDVVDSNITKENLEKVFDYFRGIDDKFSTYKQNSEISLINRGELSWRRASASMKEIWDKAQESKKLTSGYFDILHNGKYDPSGIVKGWAINNAAKILRDLGYKNYYIEAGGDIQVSGRNHQNHRWSVGIKNPFIQEQIVQTAYLTDQGIATSGTYIRGQHIYNPLNHQEIKDIVSLSVIGPNIYEADRFATAAFAMGKTGIEFIERLENFEGYMIDKDGVATYTSGWEKYTS